jgi:hypothetical protein
MEGTDNKRGAEPTKKQPVTKKAKKTDDEDTLDYPTEKRMTRSASRGVTETQRPKYREPDEDELEEEEESEEEPEPIQLQAGDEAPAFSLLTDDGTTTVSLSDFKGKKVVVYFYPKADTPGCTKQACAIRDAAELKSGDVVSMYPCFGAPLADITNSTCYQS